VNAYSNHFSFPHRGLKYFLKAARSLGIADKTYKKKLPGNFCMLLNPTEHIQQQLFWYGSYEKELGNILKKIIKPQDIFLDIGANIGYFSLLVANNVPTAKIFSFEPMKELFEKLEKNVLINGFKNIKAINIAIGNVNEDRELFLSGTDNLGMSSFKQPENFSGQKEKVKVVTIDEWFKTSGLSRIDIIKIDVEGYELSALKGMKEVLQNFKPLVIVEINPATLTLFDLIPPDIYNYLNQLNFEGYIINEAVELTHWEGEEINLTSNALFFHTDKKNFYSELFNK
jgi:FkbM family methyltransferase